MNASRPLPETDSLAAGFWRAAAEGKLAIQRCNRCGHFQHYPRAFCLNCDAEDLEMQPVSGAGRIYSFTITHRSPYIDLPPPYVVALVRLDEGVTLLTNIVTAEPERLRCDQPVQVAFQKVGDGQQIPVFQPMGGELII